MLRRLYRYFTEVRWAEAFVRGSVLFRSLSYYRDYEDKEVRADQNEGRATYKPKGGLEITNHTQGKKFTMAGSSFAAMVKQDEIFVHCMSAALSEEMWRRFDAAACVEVSNIPIFCRRMEAALPRATFPATTGRAKIGHHVEYYDEEQPLQARWAIPSRIINSKNGSYAWQREFRLAFCETNALDFQRVKNQIVLGNPSPAPRLESYPYRVVEAGPLADIAQILTSL